MVLSRSRGGVAKGAISDVIKSENRLPFPHARPPAAAAPSTSPSASATIANSGSALYTTIICPPAAITVLNAAEGVIWIDFAELNLGEDYLCELDEQFLHAITSECAYFFAHGYRRSESPSSCFFLTDLSPFVRY
ncbi:MAG: hypothetical protein LQ344_001798 [Seirophora lacunosa]|nr:MAG: hypothetical protein LQ344_001798 [Seirophora lacunosa]